MANMFFIKFYHEVLHDPKMGRLSDRLWRRFFELCLMAGEIQDGGNVPNAEDMAWTLHLDEGELMQDLEAMAAIGLISPNEDGRWFVTNFAKRQARIPGAERVARYREQQRKDTYYGNETLPPPSNEPVTSRYTELDIDIEVDKEQKDSSPAAVAAHDAPITFEDWQKRVEKPPNGSNRQAVLVSMYEALYPGRDPPAFSYIGKVARDVGGAGRLAELLWQTSTRPPTGDILAYCKAAAKGGSRHAKGYEPGDRIILPNGKSPVGATTEEFYAPDD